MEKFIYSFGAVLLLLLLVSGCENSRRKQPVVLQKLEVAEVSQESIRQQMTFPSRLFTENEVVIQPRVSGYLLSKHYDKGMPVEKGQLLYEIDPSQLSLNVISDQAALESARVQLLEAEKNYQRAIPLARIEAISQSALDQYRASYASAQAQMKMAEASLRNSQINLDYSNIYAPISGIISATSASVGDYVGPGTQYSTLSTISNTDVISAQISMPMTTYYSLHNVSEGNEPSYENDTLFSDIRLVLGDGTEYPYQGRYSYTQKNIGSQSGAIVFVIDFPNPEGVLKTGQYVSVKTSVGVSKGVAMVPQQAVSQEQNVNSVWVVRPDSTLEYRPVITGDTFGKMWIIDKGIEAGEKVLVSGQLKARNGEKIIPVPVRDSLR